MRFLGALNVEVSGSLELVIKLDLDANGSLRPE
jgi:hypothetical protein